MYQVSDEIHTEFHGLTKKQTKKCLISRVTFWKLIISKHEEKKKAAMNTEK